MGRLRAPNWAIAACVMLALACGCLPQTTIRKSPGPRDKGVRYYRPKPYLMLKPQVDDDGYPVEGYVALSLEYLPDFSEEYSIHVNSGFGSNKTSITLTQGWNLTALNVDVDSQTDEKIKAMGDLLSGVADVASATRGDEPNGFVIRATNVPLGYYEAVVADCGGCKTLQGFRYVGFMPFAAGGACSPHVAPPVVGNEGPLYALVFDQGVMTFKPLGEVAALSAATGLNDVRRRGAPEALPAP